MFAMALPSIVALLAQLAPSLALSSAVPASVAAAIDVVVALAPVIAKTAPALVETFKGIISTLKGGAVVTPEQIAALDTAEKAIDADYNEALAAAKAEDAAAEKPAG